MVVEHYRALHRIPEISFQEYCTAAYLEQALKSAGYEPVRVANTGVYADLCVDPSLPWVLFRADIDALPVKEETGLPFSSENEGVMHACGHDTHSAMLLTAAIQLKDSKLPQNIRFLFQPAEEIVAGAKAVIQDGAIPKNTTAVFGMHVWPQLPIGKMVAKAGPTMASDTWIQINCVGKNAHCSKRHEGTDALMTAARIATRFPEAEAVANGDGSVLFCGELHSGNAHNIVSAEAKMEGTLRSYSKETAERVLNKLEEIIQESAEEFGTEAKLSIVVHNPVVINDERLSKRVCELFPYAISDYASTLGAEDFALYQQEVPGLFLWLGMGDTAPLHNGKFIVPEEILPIGVDTWLKLANQKW